MGTHSMPLVPFGYTSTSTVLLESRMPDWRAMGSKIHPKWTVKCPSLAVPVAIGQLPSASRLVNRYQVTCNADLDSDLLLAKPLRSLVAPKGAGGYVCIYIYIYRYQQLSPYVFKYGSIVAFKSCHQAVLRDPKRCETSTHVCNLSGFADLRSQLVRRVC